MKPEPEPLASDVLALLRAERSIVDLEPAAKAAILASVEARLILPPVPGGAGGGGGAGGSAAGAAGAAGLTRVVAALAVTFAAGIATGAVIAPRLDAPRLAQTAPTVAPAPVATSPAVRASATLESVPVSALPSAPTPSAPRAVKPEAAEQAELPALAARGLGVERSLLDVARSALARGEAAEALDAVDRHARDYPDGALVEEREALAIKALMALGRRDEARERAARFELRFPNGLLLRAVRGAVGAP